MTINWAKTEVKNYAPERYKTSKTIPR